MNSANTVLEYRDRAGANLPDRRTEFCRVYLETMDPAAAARAAGYPDGYRILSEKGVQKRLQFMRQTAAEQISRDDVLRRLTELAFGHANDAVVLAAAWPSGKTARPEDLELSAVSELKISDKGLEVKFADRIRALDLLWNLLGEGQESARDFFQALADAGDEAL